MLKRIISSIVGLPLLLAVVALGGYWLQGAVALLSVLGLKELFAAVSGQSKAAHYVGYLFAALYAALPANENIAALFMPALLIYMVCFYSKTELKDVLATAFGFFYVPFLLRFILLVRGGEEGSVFVWLIFLSAWGSDTFAYFTGVSFGKRKLCPGLSPGKTLEGALGGVAGAAVLGAVYGWAVMPNGKAPYVFALICASGAALSQLGDLSASALKRYTGVKDFGTIIPGHGGVLDRFDSLLFTAPGVYFVTQLLA